MYQSLGAFQFPNSLEISKRLIFASPITDWAMCLLASNLETFTEINLNLGFSKFDHDPVVKSASLVPTAIAKSVFFIKLLVAFPPNPPIAPIK